VTDKVHSRSTNQSSTPKDNRVADAPRWWNPGSPKPLTSKLIIQMNNFQQRVRRLEEWIRTGKPIDVKDFVALRLELGKELTAVEKAVRAQGGIDSFSMKDAQLLAKFFPFAQDALKQMDTKIKQFTDQNPSGPNRNRPDLGPTV
jgi:hypothetical protein